MKLQPTHKPPPDCVPSNCAAFPISGERVSEFVVNGNSVFAKGADIIPIDSFPNSVTPEIHRNIVESARDAHMNMVREWGGGYYESDDFYDICDKFGIMVWQEFMFGGDMVPGNISSRKYFGRRPSTRSTPCATMRAS